MLKFNTVLGYNGLWEKYAYIYKKWAEKREKSKK